MPRFDTLPTQSYSKHLVQRGETLSQIAARYNTTVQKLMAMNPSITDPNKLAANTYLTVPGINYVEKRADDPLPFFNPLPLNTCKSKPKQNASEQKRDKLQPYQKYLIVKGDTLPVIARKYHTTVEELKKINPQITNENKIYPSTYLNVPNVTTYTWASPGLYTTHGQNPVFRGNQPTQPQYWTWQDALLGVVFNPIQNPFNHTGRECRYFKKPPEKDFGYYTDEVDHKKFLINNRDKLYNNNVNETSQFILTNESIFTTQEELVNYLMGNFIYGLGPENIIFPENGKISSILKYARTVRKAINEWNRINVRNKMGFSYINNSDAKGTTFKFDDEFMLDYHHEHWTLEHFLGSVYIKITELPNGGIRVEIFNITSFHSGNYKKDIFKKYAYQPKSTKRDKSPCLNSQPTYSNISQYFSFTMSKEELIRLYYEMRPNDVSD